LIAPGFGHDAVEFVHVRRGFSGSHAVDLQL
jgi:hypothetical protein